MTLILVVRVLRQSVPDSNPQPVVRVCRFRVRVRVRGRVRAKVRVRVILGLG